MSNSLDTVIERHALARAGAPPSRARGVVLLIHGRGATAESMLPLADVVAMPDLPPPKRLRQICEQVDLVKYRRDLSGARVRVLRNILSCTTTTDEQKIMLTEERLENFAAENETLYQIELKTRLSNWPAQGTPEESARLDEISRLWMEVVLTKALIYDLEGVITPTPSTPSTV